MNKLIEKVLELHSLNNTTAIISETLQIPSHKVRRILNREGIYLGHKTPFKANSEINVTPLLDEIMTGSMLGDGFMYRCITNFGRKNCNSRLMINYSCVNMEYAKYIESLLNLTGIKVYNRISFRKKLSIINNRTIKDSGMYCIYTEQNISFNRYRDKWYPFGIKYVPSDIVLSPLILAIWFQDDGYYFKSGKTYILCTDGFSYHDLAVLQKALLNQFNIKTIINNQKRLYVKKESAEIFKCIIENHVCDFMKYKLN